MTEILLMSDSLRDRLTEDKVFGKKTNVAGTEIGVLIKVSGTPVLMSRLAKIEWCASEVTLLSAIIPIESSRALLRGLQEVTMQVIMGGDEEVPEITLNSRDGKISMEVIDTDDLMLTVTKL